jgi:hypothetical protein
MTQLFKPEVARVLSSAGVAFLAVETSSGPHVTPLLYAASHDRIWFGIARGTLKARVLSKNPAVGVVVPGADASVSLRGEATLLDRLPPAPSELIRAPFALPAFAFHNAREMAAFALDTVRRGEAPEQLSPLSVRFDSLHLHKSWNCLKVLGWMTADGPLAVPARWDETNRRAHVPAGPLREAGPPRTSAAAISIDESHGYGPMAKRGRLLRGTGHARLRGETATVTLDVERITEWDGFDVETRPATSAPAAN